MDVYIRDLSFFREKEGKGGVSKRAQRYCFELKLPYCVNFISLRWDFSPGPSSGNFFLSILSSFIVSVLQESLTTTLSSQRRLHARLSASGRRLRVIVVTPG